MEETSNTYRVFGEESSLKTSSWDAEEEEF
jgi:hypothetical protein